MAKSKKSNTPKPRPAKYEDKLKINGSFLDVIKVVVKDANKSKDKNSIKKISGK